MRILSGIGGLILAAIVVDFALSNRAAALIGFWPLVDGVEMPLYLAMLLPLLAGVVFGWSAAHWRVWRRRRAQKKAEG